MQSMMTNMEKGALVKLFNRGGYVLDFSTPDFDAFTLDSVGVALCQKYGLSKGKSLIAYIDEANPEDSYKLLSDLLEYYETQYYHFENETNDADILGQYSGSYKKLYLNCRGIIDKYKVSQPNHELAKAVVQYVEPKPIPRVKKKSVGDCLAIQLPVLEGALYDNN